MALRYYVSSEEAPFFVNNKMGSSDRIPTSGTYKVGDFIISNTQADGIFGWVCTVAGTPGTWIEIGSGSGSGGSKLKTLTSSTVISTPVSEVEIGIKDFNKNNDFLTVYVNSTYLTENIDYTISLDSKKIVSINGNWNADSLGDYRFSFVVIKEVEKVSPEAVVGTENLKDSVVTMSKLGEDVIERLDGFDTQLEDNSNIINDSSLERLAATSKFITTMQSWIGIINTKFTDNATRFYVLAKDKVTTGVGGCIKIFADAYHLDTPYRDLGIYFHANQQGDTGYYNNGVFWINGKVSEGSEYDGKNPDIGFSFQDGKYIAGRFTCFQGGETVLVIGGDKPKSHISGTKSKLEVQGHLVIEGGNRLRLSNSNNTKVSSIYQDDSILKESLIGGKETYVDSVKSLTLDPTGLKIHKPLILTSENGTQFKLIVSNGGVLSAEKI